MERVCNEALVRAEEKNLAMEALYDVQCTGSLLGRLLLVNEALTAFPQTDNSQQQPTLSQAEQSENQSIN